MYVHVTNAEVNNTGFYKFYMPNVLFYHKMTVKQTNKQINPSFTGGQPALIIGLGQ